MIMNSLNLCDVVRYFFKVSFVLIPANNLIKYNAINYSLHYASLRCTTMLL